MSEIIILFCSIVQIVGLAAIFEMIYHGRSNRYRGWAYLIAGFAPLFKIPFLERYLFVDWAACAAGLVMLLIGMGRLFAANAEEQYLTIQQHDESDAERVIDLD